MKNLEPLKMTATIPFKSRSLTRQRGVTTRTTGILDYTLVRTS